MQIFTIRLSGSKNVGNGAVFIVFLMIFRNRIDKGRSQGLHRTTVIYKSLC